MTSKQYSPCQLQKWLDEVRSMYPKVAIGVLKKPDQHVLISASTITITSVTTQVVSDADD